MSLRFLHPCSCETCNPVTILCVLKTMRFTPAFPSLSGATDALKSLANLQTPSPKLHKPADHSGTIAGNILGILENTKHITV